MMTKKMLSASILSAKSPNPIMKKRSITIAGHRTSVALEQEFWSEIDDLAKERSLTLSQLIEEIDEARTTENLASALRLAVLENLKNQTS
ncbi:hypothetical protein GCM10007879_31930 [Maritalea porphyrae]|uniref:Ribbon-helix-helix domain-containing protein n=2 Tax=Maritalea porphyrae TaxID=880732 RepID=A0ABQ5UX09_9HYPH|nr:hypothetical protein GCM10007879_31930 [Maritalea porphyrae]